MDGGRNRQYEKEAEEEAGNRTSDRGKDGAEDSLKGFRSFGRAGDPVHYPRRERGSKGVAF